MVIREVLTKIEEYALTHIEDLNYGGCAWFTWYIYKELNKRNIPMGLCMECPKYFDKYFNFRENFFQECVM